MYVVPDLWLIYIRVPKTGSTSFTKSLKPFSHTGRIYKDKHATARVAKENCTADEWENFEKIGFIRNPYDWLESFYLSRTFPGFEKHMKIDEVDFGEYIEQLTKTPMHWLSDKNGNLMVDVVYRMEDMSNICEYYGLKENHDNPRKRSGTFHYTPYLRSVIEEKFKSELEYY